jgi:diacylglycerol kinase family enzyme
MGGTVAGIAFKRLLVLYNPAGTRAAQAKKHIAALQQAYPERVIVDETRLTLADNQTLLRQKLQPGDMLVAVGGDGSLSNIVSALLGLTGDLRSTPVLPIGTGKMNDVAHMLNGKHFADPLFVLRHAQSTAIYPLSCTITPLNNKKETPLNRLALYSIGFGMIGLGSQYYNDPNFRARQQKRHCWAQELAIFSVAGKTWHNAGMFGITYKHRRQNILDLTVSNGDIMGGYWRFPAQLNKQEFFVDIITGKSWARATQALFGLLTNWHPRGEIRHAPLEFTLHSPVRAHLDGETFMPPAPCNVHIRHHNQPVIMLSINLQCKH